MSRIKPIAPENTVGRTKELLEGVRSKLGMIPNVFCTMANSSAVLEGFVSLRDALERTVLPAKLREEIALTVSEMNHSRYCLAGHTAVGKTLGLSDEEIIDCRRGRSSDSKVDAALRFVREVVEKRGWVTNDDLIRVRDAGYGDTEIAEIIACILLDIFADYFTQVADTEVDFPAVPELAKA